MSKWEPEEYDADPMVNAVLNVAGELSRLAGATHSLFYGLKYSEQNGMSIAEAIEVAGRNIAEATQVVSHEIAGVVREIGES